MFYFDALLSMAWCFPADCLSTVLGHFHGTVFGRKDLDHSLNKINVVRYSFYSLNQTNTINNILCSQVSALAQSAALPVAHRKTAENSLFILIQGLLIFKVFLQGRRSWLQKHTHKSEFNNRTRVHLQYQTEKNVSGTARPGI